MLQNKKEKNGKSYYGKYRGIIINNQDPKNLGRITARIPEILGDIESGWAMPCVPYAGKNSGIFTVPEPETGVWIEFEGGDPSRPIWSGCWWNDNQLPKDGAGADATPPIKIIRSEQGLMVTMDDDGQTIKVSDSDGSNILQILVQDGKITIKGALSLLS